MPPGSAEPSAADDRRSPAFAAKAGAALAGLCTLHPALSPETPVIVGVSGGRDSVALLHYLVSSGWKNLIVAHFNHGMRGRESGQDAAFVRRTAQRLGLTCEVRREDIAAHASEARLSLETAARMRRDVFFEDLCAARGTRFVFLAHHLEDNAETILGNLCRGSGLAGVSGMGLSSQFTSGLVKLRPLLSVSRQEVDAWITAGSFAFREDSSNASTQHRRNRLRHEVLPLLNEVLQREVPVLLNRFAKLAARDEDCLQQLALHHLDQHELIQPDGSLKITAALRSLHEALRSRILKHWLSGVPGIGGISQRELESAMNLMTPGAVAKVNLPGDLWLRRRGGRLFVEKK